MSLPLVNETHSDAATLRIALDRFYQNSPTYEAFVAPSDQSNCWRWVAQKIAAVIARKGSCRVLELGCGRTGFRQFCHPPQMHFAVQDVTPLNTDYLHAHAEEVFVGDLLTVRGNYDVIFSTFVFEHVTNPQAMLERCWTLLEPGGALFVFCPRYDLPFYLPPSFDHRPFAETLRARLYVLTARARTWLGGRPAFLIMTDPAVFHHAWARDRDAIHLVSLFDLFAFARGKGRVVRFPIPSGSVKDWVVKNLLQVNVAIEKPALHPPQRSPETQPTSASASPRA